MATHSFDPPLDKELVSKDDLGQMISALKENEWSEGITLPAEIRSIITNNNTMARVLMLDRNVENTDDENVVMLVFKFENGATLCVAHESWRRLDYRAQPGLTVNVDCEENYKKIFDHMTEIHEHLGKSELVVLEYSGSVYDSIFSCILILMLCYAIDFHTCLKILSNKRGRIGISSDYASILFSMNLFIFKDQTWRLPTQAVTAPSSLFEEHAAVAPSSLFEEHAAVAPSSSFEEHAAVAPSSSFEEQEDYIPPFLPGIQGVPETLISREEEHFQMHDFDTPTVNSETVFNAYVKACSMLGQDMNDGIMLYITAEGVDYDFRFQNLVLQMKNPGVNLDETRSLLDQIHQQQI